MFREEIVTFTLFSSFFSFILAFPIIQLLYKFGIVRHLDVDFSVLVESRKSKHGVPIMGGLVIILPVLILNIVFLSADIIKLSMLVFVISALLGAIDDVLNIYGKKRKVRKIRRTLKLIRVHKNFLYRIYLVVFLPWLFYKRVFHILGSNPGKGLFAHEKILVQILAGAIVAFWITFKTDWINPTDLWIPFIGTFSIAYLIIPFIIFTVVSMTNAVNIADGMDGLSAGLLIPAFGALFVIAYTQETPLSQTFQDIPMTVLTASVIGALIAYLYFNIPPARFQMGDVGSLSLGALLAVIAFHLRVPLLLPILGMPFMIEVLSVVIQAVGRRIIGRRIFQMAPLHHHFEMNGWSEEKVVMRFWIWGIISSMLALWIYFSDGFPF